MSDSLVLTGVKDIKKHTGTEMVRLTPAGGGDVFRVKQWWSQSSGNAIYVDVTMFSVTNSAGTVKLAVESNMSTNLRIDVDGNFNFTFYHFNEVQRAALYTSDLALIEQSIPRVFSLRSGMDTFFDEIGNLITERHFTDF